MDDQEPESLSADTDSKRQPGTSDLLFITRAYNRKEISLDEWMERSRQWAEDIIEYYGKRADYEMLPTAVAPD